MKLSVVFAFLLNLALIVGENILVLHPVYAGSHIFTVRRITEELIHRGHKIRVLRWNEDNSIEILKSPDVSETILAVNNIDGSVPFMTKSERAKFLFPSDYMWEKGLHATSVFSGGMSAVAASCEVLLQNDSLIKELQEGNFKLGLVDVIYNECGLALCHHLGIPVIGFWPFFFSSGEAQYTTAFNPPSVIPHTYTSYTDKMNFFERVGNTLYGIGSHIVMQTHFSYTDYYIKKYLKGCPLSASLISNLSGLLINSHAAFDYAKQLPPSFFYIGGIHIRNPKQLNKDLREFIESAENGVVLMSLGMNFDAQSVPTEVYESYFRVFERLKQKVIVRSSSVPQFLPPNVKILSHVPQNDILAHSKIVLLITHGGMHGVLEAIHYGVKMVAIPLFLDQRNVAVRLVEHGIGSMIEKEATENEIYEAITKVLTDKSYEANIKRLTHIYQHTFENPLSRSVWLAEHVMEFEGAAYLKLPSKDLNFIQYFGIDVFGFLLLCLILILFSCFKTYHLFVRKCSKCDNSSMKIKAH